MAAIHSVSTFLKIMLAFFVENDFLKFLLNSFRPNHRDFSKTVLTIIQAFLL